MDKHFTTDQIIEIRDRLAALSVRDSDIPAGTTGNVNDFQAVIIDSNGNNKLISKETLYELLSVELFGYGLKDDLSTIIDAAPYSEADFYSQCLSKDAVDAILALKTLSIKDMTGGNLIVGYASYDYPTWTFTLFYTGTKTSYTFELLDGQVTITSS